MLMFAKRTDGNVKFNKEQFKYIKYVNSDITSPLITQHCHIQTRSKLFQSNECEELAFVDLENGRVDASSR
jgi:hypothetical protein